jgi:hypothetical protein
MSNGCLLQIVAVVVVEGRREWMGGRMMLMTREGG